MKNPFPYLLLLCLLPGIAPADAPPPSENSMQETYTQDEEAARYLGIAADAMQELIPLLDSVTDEASAAAANPRIQELIQLLDRTATHMRANPDVKAAVIRALKKTPQKAAELTGLQQKYDLSLKRYQQSGFAP